MIEDLNVAISSGYPKHLLYKALQRLAVAYKATGQETKAEKTYKELYRALDDAEISAEQRKKLKNDCLRLIKSFPAEKQDKISPSPPEAAKHAVPPQVPTQRGEAETVEAELQETEQVGRPRVCAVQGCPYQ